MRFVLSLLLVLVLAVLGYGFYIKSNGDPNGEIVIGVGVLIVAFILMPLFIFQRYKNKNISDFRFDNYRKKLEDFNKEEEKKS